jgi:hypothetical protein
MKIKFASFSLLMITTLIQIKVENPSNFGKYVGAGSIEQNESARVGPYVSKGASQNLRIRRMEEQISNAQGKYKQADENVFQNWISEMGGRKDPILKSYVDEKTQIFPSFSDAG